MIKLFVSSLICFLIVRSGWVAVSAADSCAVTAPDQTLSPILATGALDFSVNLYNALNNGTTNLFYSPFSVRVALAMTAVGAGGSTLVQMNQALQLNQFQSETQIEQAFQNYLGSFCPNNNFALSTANRIYLQQGFPIQPSFTQALSTYFMSSAENVDFKTDPSGAVKTINNWVEQRTNNTIRNLFSANSFPHETVLILVNAVYFKGTWEQKFKPEDTRTDTFYLANGRTVRVPTMHITDYFQHAFSAALQSQVLQLNYVGNRLDMHIILPQEGISLKTVQGNLNSQNINDYVANFSTVNGDVSLPKFKANFKRELKSSLMSLGMLDAFDAATSNLSGIANNGMRKLWVDSVMHQAYVAVDELGSEAAAATAVRHPPAISGRVIIPFPPRVVFNVDRPCIFIIYDLEYNQILFMGNLDDPSI